MAITDPKHISEDKLCTVTFHDGSRRLVYVLDNNVPARELRVDLGGDDGNYALIPYSKIKSASVWIDVRRIEGDVVTGMGGEQWKL